MGRWYFKSTVFNIFWNWNKFSKKKICSYWQNCTLCDRSVSDFHRNYHQRRSKLLILLFFYLIAFLKSQFLTTSMEYLSQICRVSRHPKTVIALPGLANSFYEKHALYCKGFGHCERFWIKLMFNTVFWRHPAMPFIPMRFEQRTLQRCFWLFRSLSNPYAEFFSQK